MKSIWLFPHRYRLLGYLLFVPSTILGLASMYAELRFDFLNYELEAPTAGSTVAYKALWWLSGGGDFLRNSFSSGNLTDEIAAIGAIIGLLFVAFAREKVEDEMISRIRLESLQWAVYTNYLILAIAILLIHGGLFFNVMIYNMFTVLIVFILRFRLLLRKQEREVLA